MYKRLDEFQSLDVRSSLKLIRRINRSLRGRRSIREAVRGNGKSRVSDLYISQGGGVPERVYKLAYTNVHVQLHMHLRGQIGS